MFYKVLEIFETIMVTKVEQIYINHVRLRVNE